MGTSKGSVSIRPVTDSFFDVQQANILMSNDTPPRACLADFGFMTMVLDPDQLMSCSAQLEGGTAMFMSPELLVSSRFGLTESMLRPNHRRHHNKGPVDPGPSLPQTLYPVCAPPGG